MSYVLTVPYTELTSLPPNQGMMYSPRLPTTLENNNTRGKFSFPSIVDSGADNCVFPARFGEMLGLDVRSGIPLRMAGFGGGGECFYHTLNVLVGIDGHIWRFPCTAGFSYQMNDLGLGLLGRHGFFELFEEVIFDQPNKIFKLKVPGNRPPALPRVQNQPQAKIPISSPPTPGV